jgi:ABC-type tungstate transport system substrate-binding protein
MSSVRHTNTESRLVRGLLIALALGFLFLFLGLPLLAVFSEAFKQGFGPYWQALGEPDTLSAVGLTILIALLVLPLNVLFGLAAAWAIAKFDFRGKSLLTTLIDLPFAVSPVVAGLLFILIFGRQGWLGPWLSAHDIKIIFALPGMVIATMFITVPYIARELIPLMQAQGDRTRSRPPLIAGRLRLADVLAGKPAEYQVGSAVWRDPRQCPCHGRVRCGQRGERPYPRRNQHPATARRDPLQRIQLGGRLRGRLGAGPAGPGDARGENLCGMADAERNRHAQRRTATGKRSSMSIEVKNITKRFGSFTALDNISLEIPTGELVAAARAFRLAARRPCCASSQGMESGLTAAAIVFRRRRCDSTRIRRRASMWALCFSTMRCSAT